MVILSPVTMRQRYEFSVSWALSCSMPYYLDSPTIGTDLPSQVQEIRGQETGVCDYESGFRRAGGGAPASSGDVCGDMRRREGTSRSRMVKSKYPGALA